MTKPTLDSLLKFSKFLLVIVTIICLSSITWNVRIFLQRGQDTLKEARDTVQEVKRASASGADYVAFQTDQLQSPAYQKYMKNNFAVGSQLQSVVNGWNVNTAPRINKSLDTFNVDLQTLNSLMANLDMRLSGEGGLLVSATELVSSLTTTAAKLNTSVDTLNCMLQVISEKSGLTMDQVLALVSDPAWKKTLENVEGLSAAAKSTTEKLDATVEQVRLAMLKAPSIAASLEGIAKASNKFAKITLIVNILATLARAFIP